MLASLETLLCAAVHESEQPKQRPEENERAPALLALGLLPLCVHASYPKSAPLTVSETLSAASLAMLAERMLLAL